MDENSYHYKTIARAINEIDRADAPISLDDLATRMGMSAPHFQRLFSAWVGVSPKRYQQYLTLGHAKTLLQNRFTTLETAQITGLSGTSRLHDLFLRWEGMSPGDFAKGGAKIYEGWFDTPFGDTLVMGTERGLCGMAFAEEFGRDHTLSDMRSRWPNAEYLAEPERLKPWVEAAFNNRGESNILLIGTPLQIKVWEALLHIPSGQVTTYSEIAKTVGSPRAVRAVGSAVGRNPISWIIPCHRALRKSGGLGGYHWGLHVKRAMLAYEGARADG